MEPRHDVLPDLPEQIGGGENQREQPGDLEVLPQRLGGGQKHKGQIGHFLVQHP